MSKTITIIQLIHLVANDDKKPYQVKYEGNIYTWDCLNHYVDRKDGTSLFCSCVKDYKDFLNDTVEIIEKQEEIDKLEIDENGFIHTNNGSWKGRKLDVAFAETINKLIDKVKNIKEK